MKALGLVKAQIHCALVSGVWASVYLLTSLVNIIIKPFLAVTCKNVACKKKKRLISCFLYLKRDTPGLFSGLLKRLFVENLVSATLLPSISPSSVVLKEVLSLCSSDTVFTPDGLLN